MIGLGTTCQCDVSDLNAVQFLQFDGSDDSVRIDHMYECFFCDHDQDIEHYGLLSVQE